MIAARAFIPKIFHAASGRVLFRPDFSANVLRVVAVLYRRFAKQRNTIIVEYIDALDRQHDNVLVEEAQAIIREVLCPSTDETHTRQIITMWKLMKRIDVAQ